MNTHKCPNIEEFKAILRKHSLKATPQRLAVHDAMMCLGHACADMVTETIKEKGTAKVTLPQKACVGITVKPSESLTSCKAALSRKAPDAMVLTVPGNVNTGAVSPRG